MQYCRIGEYLAIARMTGSQDNLLQIRLAEDLSEKIDVVVLPGIRPGNPTSLDAEKVLSAVRIGLAKANAELGTSYFISEVKIVADDAKPESVYSFLTEALIRHFDSGHFDGA